ncbi:hypothetical protein FLLO111716_06105 [Flavobacterium longum]|uniref:class I SAM-dependent methyltransferase n=1 Tax=Flavobacterium longum TaxID=1299340 RepID=UPI0039EBE605
MKDNFSKQAAAYAQFRPHYPEEMIDAILRHVNAGDCALDVATGNGQVAVLLTQHFEKVYATDISQKQIDHAAQRPNVYYHVEAAERTRFNDHQFDLITVAQAIHWFDFESFYKEVDRILKPDGIFAVMGYGLLKTNPETDAIIGNLYRNIIGPYWDAERRYIDEMYQTIPFPFDEIPCPSFANSFNWALDQLVGYLNTWSATQHYIKANGENPVTLIYPELEASWRNSNKEVVFPLLLRIGRKTIT